VIKCPDIPDNIVRQEYIKGYLKSRNLKKEDLKRREHRKQKEDLIQQLTKRIEYIKKESSNFN